MRTKAEVGILAQVSVEADLFGVWPCLGVMACGDLDRWTVLDLGIFRVLGTSKPTRLRKMLSPAFRLICSPLSSMVVGFETSRGSATEDRMRPPSMKLSKVSTEKESEGIQATYYRKSNSSDSGVFSFDKR